ncbi:tyrosine-type recombinase/integrase [Burkholderia gladioli]|uniref:tyrosine-type recombinase/integrase n=1 Tax=Burkholderia gladioli TaxID=28095 RepID=UPI00163E7368|nr:site-specific integrase [Burkholderia gladioli]
MATYRKRGSTWRAEVAKGGVRDSATFDTKAEAVAWATKVESEIDSGKRRSIAKVSKTLSDAFDEYIKRISPEKAGHDWNVERIAFLRGELDFAGVQLRKIKASHVEVWRDKRLASVKASTVNRDLNLLSAVFEAAVSEWRWIARNPVHEVKRPKNPPSRTRRVSEEDVKVMTAALGLADDVVPSSGKHYTAIAFMFAIETGMRRGEIIDLTWPNVFIEKRYVRIPTSKNGDARDVPLSTKAVSLLRRLPNIDGEPKCFPISTSSVNHAWWEARREAKKGCPEVGNLNFHDSRHEATTRLSRRLSVLALAKMIGHRDLKSLMIYYDETAAELAARLD